ncbi:MAG TPA: phosphotransferase family protein [Candidatus Angelobacter sp.]|nr:phosphotransferase family protein [Candidatus Angelobacter sp.]
MSGESAKQNLTETGYQDRAAEIRSGEELDLSHLEPFLRSHFPDEQGPLLVKQFPRGHSNLTYFVSLGDREMVLRRPPFGSKVKSAHDMGREYRVLSRIHSVYPAPKALLYCDDASILGAPFYLMERMHGIILRREMPPGLQITPEKVRRLSESFIDNLARLHSLDYAAIGLADLGKPDGYLERQVRGWIERYYGSKTHELPEVERLSAWLKEHMPTQSGATLIHNDYKYDNMVLDATDITQVKGVLDWEMCTLGDPMADLGTAIAYWVEAGDPPELQTIHWGPTRLPGSLGRSQLIQRYAEKTERDVSKIIYYYVFALFKTAVITQQIYYRYHHGLTKDARFAAMLNSTKVLLGAAERSVGGQAL